MPAFYEFTYTALNMTALHVPSVQSQLSVCLIEPAHIIIYEKECCIWFSEKELFVHYKQPCTCGGVAENYGER